MQESVNSHIIFHQVIDWIAKQSPREDVRELRPRPNPGDRRWSWLPTGGWLKPASRAYEPVTSRPRSV